MNILRRAQARIGSALIRRSGVGATWLHGLQYLREIPEVFSPYHAMSLPAVGAVVRGISKRVARLPMSVYDIRSDGSEEMVDPTDPEVVLLTKRWSAHTTRTDGLMHFLRSVLLYGRGAVYVERDNGVMPVALHPLNPQMLTRRQIGVTREYHVSLNQNTTQKVSRDDLFFLPFFPPDDGISDRSPLQDHWPAIRAALAAVYFSAYYYQSGATPNLLYTAPEKRPSNFDVKKANHSLWQAENDMRRRKHRSMVAPPGYGAMPVGGNAADAEIETSRLAGFRDVGAIYDVPPMLILQDHSRSTYSNIGEARRDLAETLTGWAGRVQAEISNIMWPAGTREVRFDTSRLALEAFSVRMQAYRNGREGGIITANEARKMEQMDPSEEEGADELMLLPVPSVNINSGVTP